MDSDNKTYAAFIDLIKILGSYYRTGRNDDPHKRAKSWFVPLSKYDLGTIEQAIHRMPEVSPEWHPSVGTLMVECRKIVGTITNKKDDEEQRERQMKYERKYDKFLETMPKTDEELDEWISKGKNKCERLGRKWMAESKRAGRRADYMCTAEEFKQRMEALLKEMGE